MYRLQISEEADYDLSRLKKSQPQAFKKALQRWDELVELLKRDRPGQWSRRINKKHRLVYEIREEIVLVLVLQAYGHYDDK